MNDRSTKSYDRDQVLTGSVDYAMTPQMAYDSISIRRGTDFQKYSV